MAISIILEKAIVAGGVCARWYFVAAKCVAVLVFFLNLNLHSFLDIAALGYEQYQDIIINNKLVKRATNNHKHCETRYKIISKVLGRYKQPFTILDLGASQGYYSFRSAWDYKDSACVMIEGDNEAYPLVGTQLLQLCQENSLLKNIVYLNKKIELTDLQRLGQCEHFDVVLALNIVHWFDGSWADVLKAILSLGDNIIIETPLPDKSCSDVQNDLRQNVITFLQQFGAIKLGQVPRHTAVGVFSPMYLLTTKKNFLSRRTWLDEREFGPNQHIIQSSFKQKKMIKKKQNKNDNSICTITSDWVPGINLVTFKKYNGVYPTYDMLKFAIRETSQFTSNDFMPNNMIVQGNKISLIDTNDPDHNIDDKCECSKELIYRIEKWLQNKELKEDDWESYSRNFWMPL